MLDSVETQLASDQHHFACTYASYLLYCLLVALSSFHFLVSSFQLDQMCFLRMDSHSSRYDVVIRVSAIDKPFPIFKHIVHIFVPVQYSTVSSDNFSIYYQYVE